MRGIGGVAVAVLATVGLLVAVSAVVEARAGIATVLLAAAVALFVPLPRPRRRAAPKLEATDAAQLPAAINEALGLEFAAVELRVRDGFERIAQAGTEPPGTTALDVRSGGTVVGRIRVPRGAERAAREIAAHAGPAFQAAQAARTLGGDLHDRVGPALAGLKLSIAARRRGADVPDLARQAEETAAEVRQVLAGEGPAATQDRGLIASLELLAARLAPEGRPAITVRSPAELPPLAPETTEAVYAIATEALTNAVKHANATHIAVELELHEDLTLVIADDGHGFDTRQTTGVGLPSMRRRAPTRITSNEHGTRVEAQISRLFRDMSP